MIWYSIYTYMYIFLQQATRTQSVYPVCVRQVRDYSGDEFKPFGVQSQIVRPKHLHA